jgi:hypothetical protein
MASTYVNDLRLEEMATGDQSGTWGDTTNTNLELIAEAFSYGTQASFGSDADATTTIADGASDPARSLYLKITSGVSLTATRTLTIAPNTVSKIWIIENATSGSQSINISQGSGANVTIPNGDVKVIYTDGAGAGAAVVDAFTDLNLGGTTTVAALDAGSGAITTTGTVTGGTLTGTLATAAQPNITSLGTITGLTTTGDINFGDNDKAVFGAGSDLQIYHDGSASYINDSGTGNLKIQGTQLQLQNAAGTLSYLAGVDGGATTIHHAGFAKLATTSTGIDVTGVITTDGLTTTGDINFGDNDKAIFGAGSDLEIYHDGSNSYVKEKGNGVLNISGGNAINFLTGNDAAETGLTIATDGAVTLYHDNSPKLATTSTGIDVTGTVVADGLDVDGTATITYTGTGDCLVLESTEAGASAAPDLVLYRNSSSPADGDDIGNILFKGKDDGGNDTSYAFILGEINDASDGSEDGNLFFRTQSGGSLDNRLSIVSNKIGINTDSPDTIMEIVGADPILTIRDTDTGQSTANARIRFAESAGGDILDNYWDVGLEPTQSLTFSKNGTEYARFNTNGNLGIGTNSPSRPLDVNGSIRVANANAVEWGGTNEAIVGDTGGALIYKVGGSEIMRNTSTGLGIGTTTADLLSIAFDGNISSDYTAFDVDIGKASGSAITNLKGINVDLASADITGTDEITNLYGAYINNSTAGGAAGVITNWWGIYVPAADPDRTDNPVSAYFGDSVGIGTTSPSNLLQVDVDSASTTTDSISVQNSGATSIGHTTGLRFQFNAAVPSAIRSRVTNATTGAGTLGFFTSADGTALNLLERMAIDNAGAVSIAGSLSKGSGSFKIDHPLESKKDTHHLVHSFVEAPKADNIYRGKVDLVDGSATVNIDTVAGMTEGTFVVLNTDVQCFTTNESDWDAVKGSVSGNILTISCQNTSSTATVSWLVIGERQDQHMLDTEWTDENGKVIVEPLKIVELLEEETE